MRTTAVEATDGTEFYTFYEYLTSSDTGNSVSLVSKVSYKITQGDVWYAPVGSIEYTYDRSGFIASVTVKDANGTVTDTESYTYDALGQLTRVVNGTDVTEYTYDNSGNILTKKVNGTVVGSYTYSDSQWKDLLTAYNGTTITYDGIGNPTSYIGWDNLTWSMGRRLTSLTNGTDSITYNYDAAGQRISKTVNGVTTEFYYDDRGALVLMSRDDGTEIYFYPDADGSIGSIGYNGNRYYYVRNAQNDIIGITDKTGAFVARYTYDEWGNITSITDGAGNDVSGNPNHIANLNPLRYRSYFYDAETGFYWLNTRYYDPVVGRFLNADSYASTGQGVIGHNMFAYCGNNITNFYVPIGNSSASYKSQYVDSTFDTDYARTIFSVEKMTNIPTSGVGAASPYVPSDSMRYNCYAYALGEEEWRLVGGKGANLTDFDVDTIKKLVVEDIEKTGRTIRPIDSYDSRIYSNEYRIALRTSEDDYHFMIQHSDGSWSHKPGKCSTRLIIGPNPDAVSWDVPIYDGYSYYYYGIIVEIDCIPNYYTSEIKYFAVSK